MQGDLWQRFLGRQLLTLAGASAVLTLVLWVTGILSGPTLAAWLLGGIVTSGIVIATAVREAQMADQSLNAIHNVLLHSEKLSFSDQLTSRDHEMFPEVAAALERAQLAIRQELARTEQISDRLQLVINSMAEGVIGVDCDQRIQLLNSAACKLMDLNSATSLNRHLWELVRLTTFQGWVAAALEKERESVGDMHLRSSGNRDLALSVSAVRRKEELIGAVVVITDVTELRRLERVRQQFVANASHELKTPITSIQACIETLIDGAVEDPQCRDRFLQTIGEQTERLDLLVKDLLTLARLESEPITREPQIIDVAPLIHKCYDRHLQTAQRKGLLLLLNSVPDQLQILAEEDALEHILDNLIDNALKYTEAGGQVSLSIRTTDQAAIIDVIDTGIGIPQLHLNRIFERFYRVDRHRSRDVGGTGLGLSIVKHLVQAIGGTINVTSRLNTGSTFSVQFPLARNRT